MIDSREACARLSNEWEYNINNACKRHHRTDGAFISAEALPEFYSYFSDVDQYLRYGQAFCNHFDIHDDVLYYCKDATMAHILTAPYLIQDTSTEEPL